jgi:hypothetical protein
MPEVGTNAELMKGRKISGKEKPLTASAVLAVSPGITAIQVSASVKSTRMPAIASHARMPAPDRKPIATATSTTSTRAIRLATREVSTCPHSTADRAIAMDWNRSKMPPDTSV